MENLTDRRQRARVAGSSARLDSGLESLIEFVQSVAPEPGAVVYWLAHDGMHLGTFVYTGGAGVIRLAEAHETHDDVQLTEFAREAANEARGRLADMPVPTLVMLLKGFAWKIDAQFNPAPPDAYAYADTACQAWLSAALLSHVPTDGTEFSARCFLVKAMVADSLMAEFDLDRPLDSYRSPSGTPLYKGEELETMKRAFGACVLNLGGWRLFELQVSLAEALAMPA